MRSAQRSALQNKDTRHTPVFNLNLTQQQEHRHLTLFITRLESIVTWESEVVPFQGGRLYDKTEI